MLSLINLSVASAQWFQTNGTNGGMINCFAAVGTDIFAGIGGGGIFSSTNYGTSWSEVNINLTATSIHSLAVSDTNLFAGTLAYGVWRLPIVVRDDH